MKLPLDQTASPHWEGTCCPSSPERQPSLDCRLTLLPPQLTAQLSWRLLGPWPPSEEPETVLHPPQGWGQADAQRLALAPQGVRPAGWVGVLGGHLEPLSPGPQAMLPSGTPERCPHVPGSLLCCRRAREEGLQC